jgi:AcrR family transcriptional regulator
MPDPTPRRYRGTSAEQRQQMRREQLLAAGLAVFGSSGYHSATVKGICLQAGLTERYFYESFANSEDLLCAVYEQVLTTQRDRMLTAISAAPPQQEAMIRAGLNAFLTYIQDSPAAARVQFIEVLGVSPRVDQHYRQAVESFAQLMRSFGLQPDQTHPHIDIDTLSVGLVGAMVGMGSRWLLSGFAQPRDDILATAEIFFAGVIQRLATN